MVMTKPKYTQEDLAQLYDIAVRDGWDQLEQSERLAVGRYCRKHGLKRPGVTPSMTEPPTRVETTPDSPAATRQEPPAPPTPTTAEPEQAEADPLADGDEDLELLRSVRFLADWPADIHAKPARPEGKWAKPAKALRRFAGRVAVLREDMSRIAATDLRRRILRADIKSFAPKGAYRAETAPDHRHEGKWIVCAQYTGDPTGE